MSAQTILLEHYVGSLSDAGIDSNSPIMSMFESLSHILGTILEQVKAFIDGTGGLILKLIDYAKQILTTPKFPKKIRKAKQAIQEIVLSVIAVFAIPTQFAEIPQKIMNAFTGIMQFIGNTSINLYQLASSVLNTVFFGDLIFKPIFSNIQLPAFPGLVLPQGPSALEIANPYLQLIVNTVLAPFAVIKALLEPFKPIWKFVQSLFSASPIKFIKSIGKLPSILSKLMAFLLNIKNAFTDFPTGLLNVIEPMLSVLLTPIIAVSQGLQDLGITNIISTLFNSMLTIFTRGPAGVMGAIQALANTLPPNPAIGLVVPLVAILKGSVIGSVDVLFGPVLNIIGFDMNFNNSTTLTQSGELTTVDFSQTELISMGFDDKWYSHQAWMNEFGLYANKDRTDVLFPDREYDWAEIFRTNDTRYIEDTDE